MPSQPAAPFYDVLKEGKQGVPVLPGERYVGYFCTYTPIEIIHAAGFMPFRVAGGLDSVSLADTLTPNFICPYMRVATERALRGEYGFLSGLVQGYTCDVACGLINIWKDNIGGDPYHLVPLPYNDNEASRDFLRSALEELIEKLNRTGGCFSEERLERSLSLYDEIRRVILDLYDMRYKGSLALSAGDFLTVIQAGYVTSPERYLGLLKTLRDEADHGWEDGKPPGIPVLVSGSLVEEPRILEIIEESGGRICADDLCTGFRQWSPATGSGARPIDRVIDRHMRRFPCPSRSRALDRAPLIIDLVRRSAARGVIFLFQKFCTPHLADYPILNEELKKEGIPATVFEMEETGIMEGQLRTRMETFFETLGERDG